MKKLSTEWTSHITDQERKVEFEKLLRNSTLSLGRLREIVETKMEGLLVTERKTDVYDRPNWTYLQAHTNGMLQAYGNIYRLLSFVEERTKK